MNIDELRRATGAASARRALEEGEGILRLAPTWVPRAFCVPGRRIRLHPDDYFALGGERGGIDERWFASAVRADNGPLTGADEGLSFVVAPDREKLPFDEVVAELGGELIGERIWSEHGGWPVYSKFFDNQGRLPFHIHHREEHASLVGRVAKPEAYYFSPQMNNHLGDDPFTFFGLIPGTTKAEFAERIAAFGRAGDNRVTELSQAYRLELGTGWDVPAGIVHAPASLCTYEPQCASDVFAMCESWSAGRAVPEELLWKDVPPEHHGDVDFIVSLLDWEANVDPDFARSRFMRPLPAGEPAEGHAERWIIYRSPAFSAKELTVDPGATALVLDAAAYGCIVVQGQGTIGGRPLENRTLIRYGELTFDEYFVSAEAARAGVTITNSSASEPLVMLKHFGPGNPDLRQIGGPAGVIAGRLRCEHREDLPLIDTPAPRFGWTLEAEGRDRRQSAYRILVASSAAGLAAEAGDLWDSGEVESAATSEIAYAGRRLPPAAELHWTVRVRDEAGVESEWATPARLRTGLDRWRARWISCDRTEDVAYLDPAVIDDPDEMLFRSLPAAHLRRPFTLERPPRRATLYATARGVLELRVNGHRVGDERLAPGWTDYRRRIEYAAHDVTALLGAGENLLGAVLGDGWYAGFVGYDAKRLGAHYGSEPELLCELHVELEDGAEVVIASDELWRATGRGPIVYADLLHGERRDARRELHGWSSPGYDDSAWGPVTSKPRDGTALVAAKAQPIRVTEELQPIAVTERGPGSYVFDLGQNMVGTVRLRAAGPAGTRIELRHGEVLDADRAVYQGNLLTARATDIVILAGAGEEVFEPRFTCHGFRYVEVSGLAEAPQVDDLTGLVVGSDAPRAGYFSCSEEMVNQLYRNIVWGQRGNFLSVPSDCPQRDERLGWLADAQVFLPTATLNADVAAFMTKWGEDVIEAQSEEGAYPDVAPRLVQMSDGAPAWADAGVIVPWILYQRYGDLRLLERHWPHMERYLAHLRRHNPDLLWKRRRNFDFGDWLAIGEEAPRELLATAYWAYDAQLMARMAAALEMPEAAHAYERLADEIAAAFNAAYVGEDGLVEGDTQTGYVLALAFDLLPEEQRAAATERLVANVERHGDHLTTGFLGVGLICPVLTAAGRADVAHRLLTQQTFPSWGYTIGRGATTIWERWDGIREDGSFQSERMNSFNHYSLGSVGSWLIEAVSGIRNDPTAVAYERVLIEPVPGELAAARGSYRSIRGEIAVEWSASEERFALAVTVPPNLTATVVIPARGGSLRERGQDAAGAARVHSVVDESDRWRVQVGSGTYEFVAG